MLEMLQEAGINDVSGVQDLFKEMVGAVLENGLEAEMEDELGYSKYGYRNGTGSNRLLLPLPLLFRAPVTVNPPVPVISRVLIFIPPKY